MGSHVAPRLALLLALLQVGASQSCFFRNMDYGGGGAACGYADMFNIVTTEQNYQAPAYYRTGTTTPPRMTPSYSPTMQSPEACQALCAAQEGCDFFSYEYQMAVAVGSYQHYCYMKGGFDDSHCHEYVAWTSTDPQEIRWSGPAVCQDGAGWKLLFRQTYPYTYRKSSAALMHNERDPSAPDYSVLAQLEDWRGADGFFKLKMTWPRHCDRVAGDPTCRTSNVWTQSSNFVTARASDGVEGFEPIDCPLSCERNPFQGLERTGAEAGNRAFADGSHVGEEANNWWYSLGITDAALTTGWYNGDGSRDGMPGPCDESQHEDGAGAANFMHTEQVTELYVWTGLQAQVDLTGPECIDGFHKYTNFDCSGADIDNLEVDVTSVADLQSCAAACAANPDCDAFNFPHPGNGHCFLKQGAIAPSCGRTMADWDYYNKEPGANSCAPTARPMGSILCQSFSYYRIKLTNYIQTSCGCGPNHGTGSGTCTPGNMDIDYWCMSELELFDAQLRPIDTTSVVATADSTLCESTAGHIPDHCENWDPMAVFDGGFQDYCSAAVPPGTRVPDFEGKLGFLAIQFAEPVQISSYTMGVKGSCTWDMPTAWVFQGSNDGRRWQDLDTVHDQVWDPAEKKSFDVDACNAESIDECVLAGYDVTEQWDCGGQDLESYAVDWHSEDDRAMCAARCAALEDCVAFNFGRSDGYNGKCWLKEDFESPPNCGATTPDWDYYQKKPGHSIECASRHNYNDVGCSDGSAEAIFSEGTVVGCDYAWEEMGVQHGEPACAAGWHICLDADEAEENGLTADTCNSAPPVGTFYATYESSGGWWNCETDGQNDIWGCGKSGPGFQISNENAPCSVLTKVIGNNQVGDCSNPDIGCWENLGADGGLTELYSTRKFPGGGGVMCCLLYEEDIGSGLVSKMLFEDMGGNTVFADTGPDGTVTNGEIISSGMRLGEGGKVDLGNDPSLSPTQEMTVCLWVTILHDHPGSWHLLATKWGDGMPGPHYSWHFALQDTTLNLYLSNDGNEYHLAAEAGSLLAEHGLVHTCFTVVAGGDVQIYVNGVPRGNKGTFTAPSIVVSEANVFVGCKQNPGGVPCGDFIVDDFQMWDRALTAEQIYKEVFVDQYQPGWGELSNALSGTCSWDSFYERTDEVLAACCETEAACPGGIPTSCSVECGQVYVPYYDECQDLILEFAADEIIPFDHLTQQCVTLPTDNMFEMIRAMKQTGCTFPNHELAQGRRQMQGLNFHHSAETDLCPFQSFDDRAIEVNNACCEQSLSTTSTVGCNSGGADGVPTECDITCALTFLPFMEECSTIIERVLDDQMPAFQALADTCHTQSARDLLYAIGDADCFGGWEKLLSDVGYAGVSDSGEVHFDREGDYTRIAAVRKTGYVSCDCNGRTEAQCGGHPNCRAGTIEPCCDNPDGHWDLCAYGAGSTVDAPFEMNVNDEMLIQQDAWNQAPRSTRSGSACTTPSSMNGAVMCDLSFSASLSDSVTLSWVEGRSGQSIADNCGTLVVDVYGCPVGKTCADDFALHLASGQVAPECKHETCIPRHYNRIEFASVLASRQTRC